MTKHEFDFLFLKTRIMAEELLTRKIHKFFLPSKKSLRGAGRRPYGPSRCIGTRVNP